METRPRTRQPIQANPTPRGRTGMSIIGSLLVLCGIGLSAWVARGGPTINTTPSTIDVTKQLRPIGTAPATFSIYLDSKNQFALFVSTTWGHSATTFTIDQQTAPATTFAPPGVKTPSLTIAIFPQPLAQDQFLLSFGAAIQQSEGGTYTPRNTIDTVYGNHSWHEYDGTLLLNGTTLSITALIRDYHGGTVLVYYDDLSLTFAGSQKQDFIPMLNSLGLSGDQ